MQNVQIQVVIQTKKDLLNVTFPMSHNDLINSVGCLGYNDFEITNYKALSTNSDECYLVEQLTQEVIDGGMLNLFEHLNMQLKKLLTYCIDDVFEQCNNDFSIMEVLNEIEDIEEDI